MGLGSPGRCRPSRVAKTREVFSMFSDWEADGDDAKIKLVLMKFHCVTNHAGTCLLKGTVLIVGRHMSTIALHDKNWCNFGTITPEEILRD